MPLKLRITSYQRLTPGQEAAFDVDSGRISIGRGQENDWVLPDPQRFMSGTHCRIEQRDGNWHLTDTSTNGTYLNGSESRIEKNDSVRLRDGDRIKLGDYELEVVLDAGSVASPPVTPSPVDDEEDIFAAAAPREETKPRRKDRGEANTPLSQLDEGMLGKGVSIDELYGLDEEGEEEPDPDWRDNQGRGSALEEHFATPRVEEQKQAEDLPEKYQADLDAIPDDWDDETGAQEVVEPAAAPPERAAPPESDAGGDATQPPAPPMQPDVPPTAPSRAAPARTAEAPEGAGNSAALAAFARGSGLDPDQLGTGDPAVLFETVGALLKAMTEGVMQAISSRGQVKSEFRLEQTMIAPTRNNPLKFSASAREAMTRLLSSGEDAYLAGPSAATEAIDDINAHQLAVLAGTEAALKSLLRRFKPSALEARFGDPNALGKAVPLLRKARYWDFYKLLYEEVAEATDDDFQKFFGSEFSNAYEKQLERLSLSRKESKP